ncbi:MAG: hypothetical protein JNM41_03935 [Flavipsychrobacter sp.]|nr:hypothetical protein [Flavipsychrobacter sp.]
MGIELELIVLLALQLIGSSLFAKFEIETPALRKIVKWLILDGVTVGLYYLIGHFAILFPFLILVIGTIFHFRFCKKNGIDPLKATPKKKYYQLRHWKWED